MDFRIRRSAMAIEKKSLKDVPSDMRQNYQAALAAVDKSNPDYAVLLLKGIIQREPGLLEAREKLRQIEKKKAAGAGIFTKWMAGLKTSGTVTSGKTSLASGKPLKAMAKAEDALAASLLSLPALNLLAQAAVEAGANFIAIEALEIAREYYPKNVAVLDWLARVYGDDGQGMKALRCRQEIAIMRPNDMGVQQKVREAAALATMEKGKWEDKDSDFRSKLKDEAEAGNIEQESRIVRNVDDVRDMIEKLEGDLAGGVESLDALRKLADLYQRAEKHDKALEYYDQIVKKMETMDPHIDRAIEKSNVAKFMAATREWQEYGKQGPAQQTEAEGNIADIRRQRLDYQLERAKFRVTSYPNDMQLRYDLAMVHWERGEVDEALQQFQFAQKNPQRRLPSLVYLGRCFHAKRQYDMAVEQIVKAVNDMIAMNDEKLDALYHLGVCYEDMGNREKAAESFKMIYQSDIKFRDVAQRMEKLYAK
jgi:tetratricopeptide (TPR) repeat protein